MANIANNINFAARPEYRFAAAVEARNSAGATNTASTFAVAPTLMVGAGHFTPSLTSTNVMTRVMFGADYATPDVSINVSGWQRYPG